MKKFIIIIISVLFNSCYFYFPEEPDFRHDNGRPNRENNDTIPTQTRGGNSRGNETTSNSSSNDTNNTGNNNGTKENTTTVQEIVPTYRYDSCTVNGILTFNVYLGWNVGEMNTVIDLTNFSKYGGTIDFNIYTNDLSMSMYGFSKYDTDFYYFDNSDNYSGYSSYSLDTQSCCKYRMYVTYNSTNSTRRCIGYWACNDGSSFYSSFKIVLYQKI